MKRISSHLDRCSMMLGALFHFIWLFCSKGVKLLVDHFDNEPDRGSKAKTAAISFVAKS